MFYVWLLQQEKKVRVVLWCLNSLKSGPLGSFLVIWISEAGGFKSFR